MSNAPYPGLRPFHQEETDIFFGREEQVDELLRKLDKARFLAVVGPSGCGKSSLVQAGMLPGLEVGFLAAAGARWRTAVMRPGSSPMRNLAEALLADSALGPERAGQEESGAFLLATLRRGPQGLIEALHETPLPAATNLLLLVDQFEEIFRYRTQVNQDEADAFVALLLASTAQSELPVYVVLTMRSDFLGDCALFMGLPEAMNDSQFLTPRLTREQRREAIEGPAAVFGVIVEPALVNRLLNDMGPDPDQLPLMQHALMRMWTKGGANSSVALTLNGYEAIGGLKNALSNHADEAFDDLDEEQKRLAEILFRSLSDRSTGRRDTRRPVKISEVAAVAGVSAEQVIAVVNVFRRPDRSFLIPPAAVPLTPDRIIDVSHESLIRQWRRLNKWVEEESASAETYGYLEKTARRWREGKAALWSTPNLESALVWEERQHPTRDWAARYGSDFDLAMEFLGESKKKREEEKRNEVEAHRKELKRKKWQLRAALFACLVVTVLAAWALIERGHGQEQSERAQQAESLRTQELFESNLTLASMLAKPGVEDYTQARQVLKRTDLYWPDMNRHHAHQLLKGFAEIMGAWPTMMYERTEVGLEAVAVSPDGSLLAASGGEGTLILFDLESGQVIKRLEGHDLSTGGFGTVWTLAFDPQGKWLASSGSDNRVILWSMPAGEKIREWLAPDQVTALAVSPDGKRLATGGNDEAITLWDAKTGKKLRTLKGHSGRISIGGLAFSPTGKQLASASYDNTARLWEVGTGKLLHVLRGHTDALGGITFSPDGKLLATSSYDETICLWEVNMGKSRQVLRGHQDQVYGLRFVGDGRTLVSASRDRTVRVWDVETGVTRRVLQRNSVAAVSGVDTYAGQVFSAGHDGVVYRWDATLPRQCLVDLPGEPYSTAIAPQGNSVAVGFADGSLHLYSLPDVDLLWKRERAHSSALVRIAFNENGSLLASAGFDNKAKLWRVREGRLLEAQTFEGPAAVHAVAISPDETTLATAGSDGQIGLFTVGTAQKRFFKAHEGRVASLAFGAGGGRLLSSGMDDFTSRFWNLDADPPTVRKEFPKVENKLMWATISPDGQMVASVGMDLLGQLYPTEDWQKQSQVTVNHPMQSGTGEAGLVGPKDTICRAIFSPDSRQLATVSADATVRLWDLKDFKELFRLQLPMNQKDGGPWDFDFRCTPEGTCWIAVPLTRGKLVLYELPYELNIFLPPDLWAQYRVWGGYVRLIDMCLQQGLPQAALQACQETLEISKRLTAKDPSSYLARRSAVVTLWKTGQVQRALKNPEGALQAFREAAARADELSKMDPHKIGAQMELTNVLLGQAEFLTEQKRNEEAKEVYDRLFAIDLDREDSLYWRARLARRLNRLDQFERDLRRVLEIDPKNVRALDSLGYTLADRTERYQEAYDLIKRGLDLQPDDWLLHDSMGWVLYKMGRHSESLEHLRKANAGIDHSSEDATETVAHLVEVLWFMGDKKEAKKEWEKGLKDHPNDPKLLQWKTKMGK